MVMKQSTLAEELNKKLFNTGTEEEAIDAWVAAWSIYFEDAQAGGPINTANFPALQAQMKSLLVGFSQTNQGANGLQSGIIGWWSLITASPVLYFSGATAATPPPGIFSLASSLEPSFVANMQNRSSQEDATLLIASVMHPANLGGIATIATNPVAIV